MTHYVRDEYADVRDLLRNRLPTLPIYCIYENTYRESTRRFLNGFPGRVMYAVKANNEAKVVRMLYDSGVRHFDCASIAEIALVHELCPDATIYFMNPVRLPGAARSAQQDYGVRHFVTDHDNGLRQLLTEIDPTLCVIFARMAVSHASAMQNLSSKFGAQPDQIKALIQCIIDAGAEPAMAFNVGTGVRDPDAYAYAIGVAHRVLAELPQAMRLLDIGGGFPVPYPNYAVPEIEAFFARTNDAAKSLSLAKNAELLAEPGRALSAPGLSALTRVLLCKSDRLYLNDGMYGAFWELRFDGHSEYPYRVFRNAEELHGPRQDFRVFGPTCDGSDELPVRLSLPSDIRDGDYIEFGCIGAYSLSGRTDFNGFHSDDVATFTNPDARPP